MIKISVSVNIGTFYVIVSSRKSSHCSRFAQLAYLETHSDLWFIFLFVHSSMKCGYILFSCSCLYNYMHIGSTSRISHGNRTMFHEEGYTTVVCFLKAHTALYFKMRPAKLSGTNIYIYIYLCVCVCVCVL
jgi:hypothetical protein